MGRALSHDVGLGSSGIWEIFIPGLTEGVKYKFEILGEAGVPFLKTDPMVKTLNRRHTMLYCLRYD